jgi:hypothetical protein
MLVSTSLRLGVGSVQLGTFGSELQNEKTHTLRSVEEIRCIGEIFT